MRIVRLTKENGFSFEGHMVTTESSAFNGALTVVAVTQDVDVPPEMPGKTRVWDFDYAFPAADVGQSRTPGLDFSGTVSQNNPRDITIQTPVGEVTTPINDFVIAVAGGTVDCPGME